MAQAYKLVLNLVLVITLVLTLSMANGRQLGIGFGSTATSTPVCNSVYGAKSGDTCTTVAQEFNFSFEDFVAINPNINCDAIFVGQWLCVDGSA